MTYTKSDTPQVTHYADDATLAHIAELERQLTETRKLLEEARKGLGAVAELINESHGVSGLHLNGDIAPWEELRTGGRFEDWLIDFDAAIKEQP